MTIKSIKVNTEENVTAHMAVTAATSRDKTLRKNKSTYLTQPYSYDHKMGYYGYNRKG